MKIIEGGSKESQETKTKSDFIRRVGQMYEEMAEMAGNGKERAVIVIACDSAVEDGENSGNAFYCCYGSRVNATAAIHCALANDDLKAMINIAMAARGHKLLEDAVEERMKHQQKMLKVYNAFTVVALLFVAAITVLFVIGQMSLLPYCGNMLIMGCALFNALMNRHFTIRQIKYLKKEFKS
jgi:uncharacterized membrane protein YgdD (TMEM256/DUF423 family)